MAPIGTLWGIPHQCQTKCILSAVAVAGLEVNSVSQGKDGFNLIEGAAIARYVASLAPESGLLGHSIKDTDQWIHFAEHDIGSYNDVIFQLVEGFLACSEDIHKGFLVRQQRSLKFLEQQINLREFLVTDETTLAEIVLATMIQRAARVTLGAAERALYPNIFVYYAKVTADPRVKDIFGAADFFEVPLAPKKVV
ncbi:glutathione S-transferase C-terminal-like protein [Suillus lakei]|nr:glutathione S-transferase C-terminal-like protein [Suillus lakei]